MKNINEFINENINNIEEQFVHLHQHDYYSFLDGYGSPEDRVKRANELGMKSMAMTNHNHLGGSYEFQEACNKGNIKPLLGVELYYTMDTKILSLTADERNKLALEAAIEDGVEIPKKALKKDIKLLIEPYAYPTKQYHILFIAKNQTGWNNLVKLQSEAARLCTYNGRFCCDDELINKYKEGILMTTACLGSIVNNHIMKNRIDEAFKILDKWHAMFKDDFYVEIQPLNVPEQALCNYYLIQYALDRNVRIVATNDVHYTTYEDIDDHDTLLCIGTGKLKSETERMRYEHEFWLRSYSEMITAFNNQYDSSAMLNSCMTKNDYMSIAKIALQETNNVADKVDNNILIGSKTPILPKLDIPHGHTSEEYLTLLSYKGLFKYLSKHPELDTEKYLDRLAFELSVINGKGYADYMLIIRDVIDWCQENHIPVGPGRGSASGSLALFATGITKCIDPIKYGLLFSRFLTMDRTSLPDCA